MKKIYYQSVILALCLCTTASAIAMPMHMGCSKDDAKAAYFTWCHAISTARGNAAKVVRLYAPGAVLLATYSAAPLHNTNGGLDDYFTKLTSHPNMECRTVKLMTTMNGKTAINSGMYEFSFTKPNGKEKVIDARFNFVYACRSGHWMIINHHSSVVPNK